jgi:signal recognition particle subunit SRP54
MGDILSLIEKAEEKADLEDAEDMARKLRRQEFTLEDFRKQLVQMKKMGPVSNILGMLPKGGMLKGLSKVQVDDRKVLHFEAILSSMTPAEREDPKVLNGSRRLRIAKGSGRPIHEVNQLLKQYAEMRKMMKGSMFKDVLSRMR